MISPYKVSLILIFWVISLNLKMFSLHKKGRKSDTEAPAHRIEALGSFSLKNPSKIVEEGWLIKEFET